MDAESAQRCLDKVCREAEKVLPTEHTCIWWRGHIYGVLEVILATVDPSEEIDFTGVEAARKKIHETEKTARHLR